MFAFRPKSTIPTRGPPSDGSPTSRTEAGETWRCTYLITAVGCLSSANVPKIDGLEGFQGRWFHTGLWPHEGVDFTGQRVGQAHALGPHHAQAVLAQALGVGHQPGRL